MAVFFNGRCACGREVCDFTCITYAAYMSKQNNIGTWQERMKKEPITNADRIRSMTDEELAEFMCHNVSNGTVNCTFCAASEFCRMGHNGWLDWLRQEVNK